MNDVAGKTYYFHHGWRFLLADAFPMEAAVEKNRDENGKCFYEKEYDDSGWSEVTLPHTFNDADIFRDRIKDAGSGQKRTAAFYRNWVEVPEDRRRGKVLIEFEGVRQTCYLYVNGKLAGWQEAGVAPFGFDITEFIVFGSKNLIAVATDNTATRDIPFCIAETPNKPGVKPGSYLFPQEEGVDRHIEGVGYFWNCNDFNPSLGGITRPVKLHFKPEVYLTLPLYSNLETKGVYIYASDIDIGNKCARITAEAEIRNEGSRERNVYTQVAIRTLAGETVAEFSSEQLILAPSGRISGKRTIVPEDAYKEELLADGSIHYIPEEDESKLAPTAVRSVKTTVLTAGAVVDGLRFWSVADPYLYCVEVRLFADGELVDSMTVETGFRKVGYDKDRGVLINDEPVWLRGYAQRASNEWAAIGIAPEWLKDMDAQLIKESSANHIRWMHVAAAPADIRVFDRQGIVCTQPAGDKEHENFGRQWRQRMELMRDVIIYFRNNPSILFWEAGNNSINRDHMRQMRLLKEELDPHGGRFMGCRTINTEDVLAESEYTGTMLNRHAARFLAEHGPITETEYSREEAPRRIWDDYSPPDFDYRTKWLGKGGRKQPGRDFYDLTSEDFALTCAAGYSEFFNDRIGGASGKDYYSGCAALCWTDSAQHGRQAFSENARMSGRVDPVRIKKQSFDVFRVMQSPVPLVKIIGHWNYPPEDGDNYRYHEKRFNGDFWEDTGKILCREPKKKTVYVAAGYEVERVKLFINGRLAGECSRPIKTFIFPFENVDVTESGEIRAEAYDYDGRLAAADVIKTAGAPEKLRLSAHTSPDGLVADGADIAYVDIEVTDSEGNICPLCSDRIELKLEGEGELLGGYNSGRFAGYGRDDSVIHKEHVFAECGTNRIFIRAGRAPGKIKIDADMSGIAASVTIESVYVPLDTLTETGQAVMYPELGKQPQVYREFRPIPEADKIKYEPDKELYSKILVNGQEPDTRGVRTVNKNGSIWGSVVCILERLKNEYSDGFEYKYLPEKKQLVLTSGSDTVTAEAGRTHLLVNGNENLMDGEPYITPEGFFVMEVGAIVSYIKGVRVWYDDKINVLRIETSD